jgi:PLP dependent protein
MAAPEVERFAASRREILDRIALAAGRANGDAAGVTVVAVTKTVAPDRIRDAVAGGWSVLGENRVQEAVAKIPVLASAGSAPTWHLIGPLQSNKARRAVDLFDVVETVDSLALARRLDRLASELRPDRPLPVYLQVNVDADPSKAGFSPAEAARAVDELASLRALDIAGLMTVGRLVETAEAARPTFVALRRLSERIRAGEARLGAGLSMGMTDDFEVAVEEGATLVRLGRAIFGARPTLR